jgi:hypothetical protein
MRKADFTKSFVRRGAVAAFGQVAPEKMEARRIQTAQETDFGTKKWPRGRGPFGRLDISERRRARRWV